MLKKIVYSILTDTLSYMYTCTSTYTLMLKYSYVKENSIFHTHRHTVCAEIEPKMSADHYVDRDIYESELSKVCTYVCMHAFVMCV